MSEVRGGFFIPVPALLPIGAQAIVVGPASFDSPDGREVVQKQLPSFVRQNWAQSTKLKADKAKVEI
jgi:hypothetical protein